MWWFSIHLGFPTWASMWFGVAYQCVTISQRTDFAKPLQNQPNSINFIVFFLPIFIIHYELANLLTTTDNGWEE